MSEVDYEVLIIVGTDLKSSLSVQLLYRFLLLKNPLDTLYEGDFGLAGKNDFIIIQPF